MNLTCKLAEGRPSVRAHPASSLKTLILIQFSATVYLLSNIVLETCCDITLRVFRKSFINALLYQELGVRWIKLIFDMYLSKYQRHFVSSSSYTLNVDVAIKGITPSQNYYFTLKINGWCRVFQLFHVLVFCWFLVSTYVFTSYSYTDHIKTAHSLQLIQHGWKHLNSFEPQFCDKGWLSLSYRTKDQCLWSDHPVSGQH